MEHAPKYPVSTLEQMAEIPEEALPRFIAELPSLLDHFRARKQFNAMFHGVMQLRSNGDPVWIDDGEATSTVAVADPEGQDFQIVTKIPRGAP